MTKYQLLKIFTLIIVLTLCIEYYQSKQTLDKIKQKDLICYMEDGERHIPGYKIIGYDEATHTYYFENGYAQNCILEK
jgi:hypothetical protein